MERKKVETLQQLWGSKFLEVQEMKGAKKIYSLSLLRDFFSEPEAQVGRLDC